MFTVVRCLITFHPAVTFLVMGAAFAGFSLTTLEVFHMLSANLDFIARFGAVALMEGAGHQLAGLALTLFVALACYLVFKGCERILVDRLCGR
jgi:hypothetical protein